MGVAAIPAVALAISAAGTAFGVYSQMQNASAQKAAAEYQSQVAANNAKIAGYNANQAIETGNTQLQAAQEQAAQRQGMIRAVMGAGGLQLNSGSPLRQQEGMAEVDQLNQATITSNAARSAWNYRNQGADFSSESDLATMKANQDTTAGIMGGFSTLLSGAGSFANQWSKFYPSATS